MLTSQQTVEQVIRLLNDCTTCHNTKPQSQSESDGLCKPKALRNTLLGITHVIQADSVISTFNRHMHWSSINHTIRCRSLDCMTRSVCYKPVTRMTLGLHNLKTFGAKLGTKFINFINFIIISVSLFSFFTI